MGVEKLREETIGGVRFQKKMRQVSLEIPEPNAPESQIDQRLCDKSPYSLTSPEYQGIAVVN